MIQEGSMGEWKTVYEDEVEERWVTVKVYESEDDKDEDEGPVVRVTAAPIEENERNPEQNWDGRRPVQKQQTVQSHLSLIPLRTSRRS
jgi:hypothetical protein